MALLHSVSDLLSWLGWYVLPFIVILSAIVFIHELGHYLVGRWCGVRIDAFSIGFGPELFARVDSHGTRWRVGALPLGGYVKFHGDANAASVGVRLADPSVDRARTLAAQPVANRAAIVLAGPVANFILAFVIFTGFFLAFGRVEHMRADRPGGVEQPGRRGRLHARRPRQVGRRRSDRQLRGAAGSHADEHRAADDLRGRSQTGATSR